MEGCVFKCLDAVEWLGSVGQRGLVRVVDGVGQGVVIRVAHAPLDAKIPCSFKGGPYRVAVVWVP